MKRLLYKWISSPSITNATHHVFVMRWGREIVYPNYAKNVWREAKRFLLQHNNLRDRITVFRCIDHPTFPQDSNNFIERVTGNFQDINNVHQDIFSINDVLGDGRSNAPVGNG